MRVTRTYLGGVVFIGLRGRLTVNANWGDLHAEAREILDPEVRGVFVDLENATWLDCAGIGELVRLRNHVVSSGRAFGLVNPGRDQRLLLALLRIRQVLRIYGSRRDVVRTLIPSRRDVLATNPLSSVASDPRPPLEGSRC